jgi:hypothetical protein
VTHLSDLGKQSTLWLKQELGKNVILIIESGKLSIFLLKSLPNSILVSFCGNSSTL